MVKTVTFDFLIKKVELRNASQNQNKNKLYYYY